MKTHTLSHLISAISALAILATSFAACADEQGSAQPPGSIQASFGVAALSEPRYAGSKTTFAQVVPLISVQKGPWFVDTVRGLGAQYQTGGGLTVSEALHYDFGRLDKDSNFRPGSRLLKGMGNVPGSVVSRTIVAQQFNPLLSASAEAEYSLKDGTHRGRYRAGVELGLIQKDSDILTVNADVHAGNASFNRAYFGVSTAQSGRSGFASYKAKSGLFAYSASVSWIHLYTPHWSTSVVLRGTHYINEASDSPIVKRHTALGTALAVNYSL